MHSLNPRAKFDNLIFIFHSGLSDNPALITVDDTQIIKKFVNVACQCELQLI